MRRRGLTTILTVVAVASLLTTAPAAAQITCGGGSSDEPPPPLSFESFAPETGSPGTEITLTGAGFTSGESLWKVTIEAVTFNGAPADFQVDSFTEITAVVPSDATAGPITITRRADCADDGSTHEAVLTSAASFVVTSQTCGDSVCVPPPDPGLPQHIRETYERLADQIASPQTPAAAERALARVLARLNAR